MTTNEATDEYRAEAARLLGMKPREVVEVAECSDGVLVKTHDGNWTLVREDYSLEFLGKDPTHRLAGDSGEVDEPEGDANGSDANGSEDDESGDGGDEPPADEEPATGSARKPRGRSRA